MKSNIKIRLFAAVLTLIILPISPPVSGGESEPPRVECDVHAGPCRAHIFGTKVSLDIEPKPVKAMQDLTFTLTFTGAKLVEPPYIDLNMPGMNMGRNRVILELTGESIFQGKGVIVR